MYPDVTHWQDFIKIQDVPDFKCYDHDAINVHTLTKVNSSYNTNVSELVPINAFIKLYHIILVFVHSIALLTIPIVPLYRCTRHSP